MLNKWLNSSSSSSSSSNNNSNSLLQPYPCVVINVWHPMVNGHPTTLAHFLSTLEFDKKGNRVGHVSMEIHEENTQSKYVSLFPGGDGEVSIIYGIKSDFERTYQDDVDSEESEPNLRIALYSLDVEIIKQRFADIVHVENTGYVLLGDKKKTRLYNKAKAQSCCGVVYELLVSGGVFRLQNYWQDLANDLSLHYIVVTPENFAAFIQRVKQREEELYPETKTFVLPTNNNIVNNNSNNNSSNIDKKAAKKANQ